MPLISCEELSVGYDSKVVAEHISFSVNRGDYICIVGENGSGKSTLLKTILHLMHPVGGTLAYGDGLHQNEIGYLPQQTVVQKDFPASVWEIVLSGCQAKPGFHPFYSKEDKERAKGNIKRMGLEPLAKRCYRELSGGQQQRVLLARALCAGEKILLLDEPVAGLDPKVTAELYQLIKRLNEEGLTIVMISHDIAMAVEYASHILHVGKRIFFGTKEEYQKSELGKLFLLREGGDEA